MRWLKLKGYASLFNVRDISGDVVKPGAFAKSLAARNGPLPLLLSHETTNPVGVWTDVREDSKGLYVEGRLYLDEERGRLAARMVQTNQIRGLSIGFRTADHERREDGRDLTEIDLWEISIVGFPMLTGARITDVEEEGD